MVTLVCYIKPALSRFSNAVKINALSFIYSVLMIWRIWTAELLTCVENQISHKTKITNKNVLRKKKQHSLHFTKKVVRQKLATLATFREVPVVQMFCCCWKEILKERKQEEDLQGHGLMTCCNKQSKTNKYRDFWSKRTGRWDIEKGDTSNFIVIIIIILAEYGN